MTKGLPRSLKHASAFNAQDAPTKRIRLDVNEVMAFTGSTGIAVFQTADIGGLPEGNFQLIGAVANLTFTGPTSADLADDFQGDFSIGTEATIDNDLGDTDEANIIASTAIAAATAEVSASNRSANATSVIVDNTAADKELNLNILIDADEITNAVAVNITVTGTVDITYSMLGDD